MAQNIENINFVPTCVTPVPPIEKSDIISTTNLGQIIIHDITHHYHNHFLHHPTVITTKAQQQQYLPYSLHYNYPLEIDTSIAQSSTTSSNYLSPNNNNNNNITINSNNSTTNLPSSNNLGFILAQYGYVPRATFRPTILTTQQQQNNKVLNETIDNLSQYNG